jgi:hypothetical protein
MKKLKANARIALNRMIDIVEGRDSESITGIIIL